MTDLFERILVPVASVEDAKTTATALVDHVDDDTDVTVVYVVEKAGGAPDKASVEQREAAAQDAFDVFVETLGHGADTEIRYATDVVEAVGEAAADVDANAIVFVPRPGGRIARFLSGDLSLRLVTESDRPVIALPDGEE